MPTLPTAYRWLLMLLAAAALSACGSTTQRGYTHPSAPVAAVQRVAVMAFDGVPEANAAADVVAMVLANRQVFKAVVDRSQIAAVQAERAMAPGPSGLAQTDLLVADALLTGRVTRYEQGRVASPFATPTAITISLKLVSAKTGQVLWTQLYARQSALRGVLAPDVDGLMLEMAESVANDLANLK